METEIRVNEQLSASRIMEILEKYPELEKIKCPHSIYQRISPKYLDALEKLGIKIEIINQIGRPPKYDVEVRKNVQIMLDQGLSPSEVAQRLKIPIKTVYYLKNKHLKRGRKRKYDNLTEKRVKKLFKKGLSAQKISEKLEIPLRTVYYLRNR